MTTPTTAASARVTLTVHEAIRRLSVLKGELKNHTERASASVCFEEGGPEPIFSFEDEVANRARVQSEVICWQAALSSSNGRTRVQVDERGMTVAELLKRIEEAKADKAFYEALKIREGKEVRRESEWDDASGRSVPRRVEVTFVTHLGLRARVQKVDLIQTQIAMLNRILDASNHRTKVTVELPHEAALEAPAVP